MLVYFELLPNKTHGHSTWLISLKTIKFIRKKYASLFQAFKFVALIVYEIYNTQKSGNCKNAVCLKIIQAF